MNNTENSTKPESFMKIQLDHYRPPKFIVSEMIPTGVHLFAGSPKTGKWWLMLWLCDRVAKGKKVWEYDTDKCTVLYIALEDTKSTLHFRLDDITEMSSENAYAVTTCSSLNNGLLDEIDEFIDKHPETRLVVIDTLQLVRDSDRAAPLGTGHIKVGGNYAASLKSGKKAKSEGYASVLFLDSKEKKYIDECGPANFFGIKNIRVSSFT